ncbi:RES family NAD+ phosphorylase [Aquiflexum gelatinilyticum]|uniref:RES family NAD+ phosphorylase n=1 Tax=Aquiflexum gelatinilyticum TaxID=2961943 RepID=A0A9X2T3J3_9BACT|nr:RES family NAD+ phosphorylase [Aquiflexum gelatinilyticum]MCR9016430.1 RES family NAD+ phosphorylase [Aquiflexum gelatinilyticum]
MESYKKENGTSSSSENKSSKNGKMSFDAFQSLDVKDFFRIRPLTLDKGKINSLIKEDMFHIKYQERRKCRNYRFSISGVPALYLGDTIELCEKEIFYGMDVSQYYVSYFRNQDSFKVITIDFPESVLWGLRADNFIPSALRFFAYLPFSVACLFRTAPPHNHSFNPEYIIPQLLMSFLKKNTEVDGVRFPSTKFPYNEKIKPSFNYAFPVKEPDEDGFCKNLKRIFDWTDPILSEIDNAEMKSALSASAGKIGMPDSLKK